jgi:beta-N-acetylhexosaminidase
VSRRPLALCICLFAALLPLACGDDDGSAPPAARAGAEAIAAGTAPIASVASGATRRPTRHERIAALRPRIVPKPITLSAQRRQETIEYADRHYGIRSATIDDPHVIVEHYTVTPDFPSTYAVFAPDKPDAELGELPGLCSQFVVDRDGTIYQLTPVSFMCRHTVGLNYTAIGIEHVGSSDREVLTDRAQMRASLKLTRWLRCRSRIGVPNVIGHSESLSSPYHRERVARLKTQTHGDWTAADMQTYRQRLRVLGTCPR